MSELKSKGILIICAIFVELRRWNFILWQTVVHKGEYTVATVGNRSKSVAGANVSIFLAYTPQKMFLLAFSFANFKTTRGNTGKANINYTAQKKLLLNFQNSQMKKRGETLFGECTQSKGFLPDLHHEADISKRCKADGETCDVNVQVWLNMKILSHANKTDY